MIQELGKYVDPDTTEKFVFKDEHGIIEIVRINTKSDRDIFCVPSLYGCSLGCSFCFLTTLKVPTRKNKKIESKRILECLDRIPKKHLQRQISIMGVGDPLLNLELIKELGEKNERISIASIFPLIPDMKILENSNTKVHFSMHSPVNNKRREIMPSGKIDVEEVLELLFNYKGKKEIHYTLIRDVNDSDEELEALFNLLKTRPIPIKFLDFKESGNLKKSPKLRTFLEKLQLVTIVEFYSPPGEKIQGSCGQFTDFFYKENFAITDEFKEFEKAYAA